MKFNEYLQLDEMNDNQVAEKIKLNRLWNAIKNDDMSYFQGYIDANGDVNVKNNKNTLLTTAAFNGRYNIVSILLPKMDMETILHKMNGETADIIAKKRNFDDVASIISKKIATLK
jgi:ankyrin repeat protein